MNPLRPRILAIDDTPNNLRTLCAALHDEFQVQIASSGAMGLEMAAISPPELILLDVMMPEMDGYETLRRFKADPALSSIPVIFISALNDNGSENIGLQMGAADYISKPIKIEITRNRIRNLFDREQMRRELEAHRDQLEDQVRIRTAALSIALEMAEINNRAKNRFLANMSHEFRTPLNGILGMAELALYRATDPKLKVQLIKVRNSSESLLSLFNNVLDLTRLEANKLTLVPTHFRLGTILDTMTELFDKKAKDKGLEFTIDSVLCDRFVEADSSRLIQILQDLVGNAIKFCDTGQVSILASQLEESATDVLVRFEVLDTGIGILVEDQKRIFNAFEQADDSTTRKYGGTGVGLAISRHLAALMGGELGVESMMGSGSLFWFTARLKKSTFRTEPLTLANSAKERITNRYPGARILLAEDDILYQDILSFLLTENGFVVDVAESCDAAYAMASTSKYLVMIINLKLMKPKVAKPAAIPGHERLAVLVITDDDTDRYGQSGMNDIVSLIPFDQERLYAALEKCLATSLAP